MIKADFLVMQKNSLIRKLWLISKFMTSQAGQKVITIYILPKKHPDNEIWTVNSI